MKLSFFRADDTRSWLVRAGRLLRQARAVVVLPQPVRRFYLGALYTAWRTGDQYSLHIVTRPIDLREILRAAGTSTSVAEMGTATGWTSIALALAQDARRVVTYDPEVRPERARYLALVRESVRARITAITAAGHTGPGAVGPVEFVFEDGSHQRADTVATFRAWSPALVPGGRIAFHDYGDPAYPGVAEAIADLGLSGQIVGRLYIWTKPR